MASHIQGVHIADGFADDCDELIHRCLKTETLTFEAFTEIWKDMQLGYLFYGRQSGAEIAELSEEVIMIAKRYMVADTSNFEESVAGLFLVYSLLNLQPFTGFAALRIIQDDIPAIKRIEMVARRDRRHDVLYILGSVLIKGPVQFHAELRERGMEGPIRKYLDGCTTIDKLGIRPKGVFYRQNEELDIINEIKNLAVQYANCKEKLVGPGKKDRNLEYVKENFATDLATSLKNIIIGNINETKEAGGSSSDESESDAIKKLKEKAMKSRVNPIRHRVGVCTRTQKNSSPETKSPPKKSRKLSASQTTPKVESKRKKCPQRRHRKNKFTCDSDEESSNNSDPDFELDDGTEDSAQETQSDTDKERNKGDDLDLTQFNKAVSSADTEVQEVINNIEIDALPTVMRTGDFEIEIIDKLGIINKEGSSNNNNQVMEDIIVPSTSGTNMLKKTSKREQKQTLVKSRFKRLGILPLANPE